MPTISQETLNVIRVSISMMVLFTAILSQEFITEPLLSGLAQAGIGGIGPHDGYICLCIIYAFNTISCPFAPYVVTKMTGKWAMVVGMVTTLVYQASFLFPQRTILFLSSALVGSGTTFLWVGQGQYITDNVSEASIQKNTSIQWAFFKLSLINGGIFFLCYFQNSSISDIISNGMLSVFIYIFMGCTVVAIINNAFLPQSEVSKNREKHAFFQLSAECFKLLRSKKMLLFTLFFFYTGVFRSFWISIFPTCIKFTDALSKSSSYLLSLSMLVTGVGQVLGSGIVAIIGNRLKRHNLVLSALMTQLILFIGISLTFPDEAPLEHTKNVGPVFYPGCYWVMTISGLLGFSDAIIQTQVYSYIAKYYQNESSSAFAIFRCFAGISSSIIFFVAQYCTLAYHLIILTVTALIAGLAVLRIVRMNRQDEQKNPTVLVSIFQGKSPFRT